MIRESNNRQRLIKALSALIPEAQTETHTVDEAAAAHLRINRTDLRCLGIVFEQGSLSASKLAESVGLTRAAMTTALDRLEKAGYIRRLHDPLDRRGVNVEATRAAQKALRTIWEPIRLDGLSLLEKYRDQDIAVLIRFFKDYCALQRKHAHSIQQLRAGKEGQ